MNTQLNMKKLLLVLITGCLMATGCAELLRDELADVHNQIEDIRDELELLKEQMNTNIGALRVLVEGLQSEDLIKSVVPITEGSKVIGYTITFTKSQPITIYHGQDGINGKDGKDGTTPVIGVKQDNDGAWYWTIGGEWMTDSAGNKVPASAKDGADGTNGVTPQLKIEEGYWYVSIDDGQTWTQVGKATGDPGDSMFLSIDTSNETYVTLVLADGTILTIPRNCSSQLVFSLPDEAAPIQAGETRSIPFTISGSAPDKAMVTVASDGSYVASVHRTSTTEGTISVTAPNPYSDGHVIVLLCDANGYSSMHVINFCRRRFSLSDGAVFRVNGDGGTVTIPWTGNYLFSVSSAADWIHPIRTRTDYSGEIVLSVDPNPTFWPRTGIIRIHPEDNPGYTAIELVIEESTASVLPFEPKTMVLTVRPSYANDFTVYLPFRGNVHCSVDWGDGTVDSYVNNLGNEWIHHTYDVTEPTDFKVSITGTASQMDAHDIPQKSGIISVDHWGNMGIEQVHHAFYQITSLQSVCADTDEFFARVTSCVSIFQECASLDNLPGGLFRSGTNIRDFSFAFHNCASLSSIDPNVLEGCSEANWFRDMFSACRSLHYLPEDLFRPCIKALSFDLTFSGSELVEIPEGLFASCPDVESFASTFRECHNMDLTTIPSGLFDHNRKVVNFGGTFWACWYISSESPYTLINGVKVHLYERKDWKDYFVTPAGFSGCFNNAPVADHDAAHAAGWCY